MSDTRLFVPAAQLGGARVVIEGDAHKHVARVLRARPGDALVLFDGEGGEVDAMVETVGAREATLVLGARRTAAAPVVAITLLVAVPRGERMDLLVQKTTELGVARIMPVLSGRSVARPEPGSSRTERWDKIAREAARQCGRADVPRLDAPTPLAAAVGDEALPPLRFATWEAARGEAAPSLRRALAAAFAAELAPRGLALLVGPEGGFAAEEIAEAEAHGFSAVGLGPRILRVETAAIAAVTLAQAAAGGLD
ncbi:MAG TPA: 16S rRNA (uracil(1498)-N(3))-methyltransferase [Polyangia bacterium]|nr:16S rRNA (uracil(1498)-N(3))-methyltransferase [Polyangia bacterium]